MLLTTILDWLKVPLPKPPIVTDPYIAQPQWQNGTGSYHPVSGLMPSPLKEVPDVILTPQLAPEKIMENEWYKEKWATDFMGTIAGLVFKTPVETPVTSPQQPVKTTDLGAKIEFGDWTLVVSIISIVALILLFFFLRQRTGRAY